MDPGVQCHGMKANPTGYLWSKYEWLPRYRLLENFNIKWNRNGNAHGNGNAYDRGDYNSFFALRAVELKNYDGLESPMLNTKFRENLPAGSGEDF